MLTVKKIMTKIIEKVNANTTVQDIAKIMAEKNIGCVVVEENGRPIGIITETDIVRKVVGVDVSPKNTPANKIMNSPVLSIDSDASILAANDLMDKHHIRHLVVTEEDVQVGVLSVRDLIHPTLLDEETY